MDMRKSVLRLWPDLAQKVVEQYVPHSEVVAESDAVAMQFSH